MVVVCAASSLTVSEANTEIICLPVKGMLESTAMFSVEASGQVYNQTNKFVSLGGKVNHNVDLSIEIKRRIRNAWYSFRKYTLGLYNRPNAPRAQNSDATSRVTLGNAVRLRYVEPARVSLRHAAPSPSQLPDLLQHLFLKKNRTDHSIFYLDTLVKTGSGSIKATVRRSRILFAGFVARTEDTRLPKCVIFGKLVGRGLRGGAAKRVYRMSPERPQSFRYQRRSVDDCSPGRGGTAQDGVTRGGTFHGEMYHYRENQGWLRHVVVCSIVTGRTKERIAQSKRACAGSLAEVD